jgi:hypothetical protein
MQTLCAPMGHCMFKQKGISACPGNSSDSSSIVQEFPFRGKQVADYRFGACLSEQLRHCLDDGAGKLRGTFGRLKTTTQHNKVLGCKQKRGGLCKTAQTRRTQCKKSGVVRGWFQNLDALTRPWQWFALPQRAQKQLDCMTNPEAGLDIRLHDSSRVQSLSHSPQRLTHIQNLCRHI